MGEDYLRTLFSEVSNWGRWGADDQLGTLNLIDTAARLRGVASVRDGRTVSLSRPVTALTPAEADAAATEWGRPASLGLDNHGAGVPSEGFGVTSDSFAVSVHGATQTHLDALCHIFFDGRMYNGRPASEVPASGSTTNDISRIAGGVVTRGVLLDVPALRGGYVRADEPVRLTELEEAERRTGVEIAPGDALLIRLGRDLRWAAEGGQECEDATGETRLQGMHPEVLGWLRERDVGILVSDNGSDVTPPAYGFMLPIHIGTLVFLGCPLIDNADLEGLAAACAEVGRADFLFTVAPIPVPGATGSLVNPLAIV